MLAVEGAPIRSVSHFMPAPDPRTGIPMEVVLLIETEADQSLLCSGSYYSRERIYDTMIVTDRDSYRLNILESTLTTGAGTQSIESEQENCTRFTVDFIAPLEQGRAGACAGRAGPGGAAHHAPAAGGAGPLGRRARTPVTAGPAARRGPRVARRKGRKDAHDSCFGVRHRGVGEGSNGFTKLIPLGAKSSTLRVARVSAWVNAEAAIRLSRTHD